MLAKIAVGAAVFAMDKPYSYKIPDFMTLQPGERVMVPFGKGNRRTEGVVLSVEQGTETGFKAVDRALDTQPVLDGGMLRLAAFVRERCFCTFYEAVKAMLPAGLWFSVVDTYTAAPAEGWRDKIRRQTAAAEIFQAILDLGGRAEYSRLRRQFPDEEVLQNAIRYLLGKKLLTSETDMLRRIGDKTEKIASLAVPAEDAAAFAESRRRSAPLQHAVLSLLASIGSGCCKEICYFTGCSMTTIRRLEKLGYLTLSDQPLLRRAYDLPEEPAGPVVLNGAQQAVFDGLCALCDAPEPGTALLYGVTGSGKTAVYLRLIDRCLERGRAALMLVPEIALTPQLLRLFTSHFGSLVAVLHSGLRIGERYDEWKRIRSGDARVVVGTRSAVFAPVCNLGILIVDEEQEHTYKSENVPRYHAREVAVWRGAREHALVLLGSATPSVETMYHARMGDCRLFELRGRYNGQALPEVRIVDMKQELRRGNATSVSAELEEGIRENLHAGRQTILFLNRRGAGRLMVCVGCGYVPRCPRCSVNLTYHAANRRLMCHYCGHSEPLPERCPECGGHLKPVGTGTQKVERELHELFPGTPVLRMDSDTVSAVNSHEKLLSAFERDKIPILIGTQMVAKGLNFENVTLVGVLDADLSLYVDNYRAAETTFSMLTQVIGRAGRGAACGRALIQTMTPDNAVIRLAAAQDYDRFYEMEIVLRKLRGCPPFADLMTVTFAGPFEDRVAAGACRFRDALTASLQAEAYRSLRMRILGPAPAAVAKVNNLYRYRLTVCCANSRPVRQLLAYHLREFLKEKRSRGVTAFADVNSFD